jgi:hypothetical protein
MMELMLSVNMMTSVALGSRYLLHSFEVVSWHRAKHILYAINGAMTVLMMYVFGCSGSFLYLVLLQSQVRVLTDSDSCLVNPG